MKFLISACLVLLTLSLHGQTDTKGSNSKSPFNPYVGMIFESNVAGGLGGFYAGTFVGKRFGLGAYYERPTSNFDSQFNENRAYAGIYGSYNLLQES